MALYGLKQVGRQCFYEIFGFPKKIGSIQYNIDSCLFGQYKNIKLCLLLTHYVDDILIAGENKETTKIVSRIKHKYKVSTDKTVNKLIGFNIIKNK